MAIMFVNIYSLLRGTFKRMNWKTKKKAKPFAHHKINMPKLFSHTAPITSQKMSENREKVTLTKTRQEVEPMKKTIKRY